MSPLARSAALRTTATRAVARRQMSTEPKMHKAKDKWGDLLSSRPPKDAGSDHLVFHPPFNGPAVGAGLFTVWCMGYGTISYGIYHQQKKQGYYK